MPVTSPQDLVFFAHGKGERPGASSNYPLFERYRAIDGVFSGVTAFSPTAFKFTTNDGLENVTGLWVNGTFHGVLGVPMAIGRGFSAESDQPTDTPTAVISDAFWLRRFGRDPSVLDRTITLDGRAVAIVGVTAPEFTGTHPGNESRRDDADRGARDHATGLSARCTIRGPISRSSAASSRASRRQRRSRRSTSCSGSTCRRTRTAGSRRETPTPLRTPYWCRRRMAPGCCGVNTKRRSTC